MTTAAQIKKLVKPLLERHSDLALTGSVVVVKPVQHLLRFVFIERTGEAARFRPRWSLAHLFHKLNDWPVGYGEFLSRHGPYKRGLWWWSEPDISQAFTERVETELLPKLRAIQSLRDYYDFSLSNDRVAVNHGWGVCFLINIAEGNLDAARDLFLKNAPGRDLKWFDEKKPGLGGRLLEQGARLSAEDRTAIAEVLHEWVAYSVDKLKLASVWEKTPFPLELQSGHRN